MNVIQGIDVDGTNYTVHEYPSCQHAYRLRQLDRFVHPKDRQKA